MQRAAIAIALLFQISATTQALASGVGDLYSLNRRAEGVARDITRTKQDATRIQTAVKFRRELVSTIRALPEARSEDDKKYQAAIRGLKIALEVVDDSALDADRCSYYRGLKAPAEAEVAKTILEALCAGK